MSVFIDYLQLGVGDVEVSYPPSCYEVEYQTLLTPEAVKFVVELVGQFDKSVDQVMPTVIFS